MRHLMLIGCCVLFLFACKKGKRADKTCRYEGEYKTLVIVNYYADRDQTEIYVGFTMGESQFDMTHLQLSGKDPYLKINNIDIEPKMEKYQGYYYMNFSGKVNALVEFRDFDEVVHANAIFAPDTAYFINLPDTVSGEQDLEFMVNAPVLDSGETSFICLDGCGDTGIFFYSGTNEIIFVDKKYLDINESPHVFTLQRSKTLSHPSLPSGGGYVEYNYIVDQVFYVE